MAGGIKKTLGGILKSEEQATSEWMKKTKEDMTLKDWLKKARKYEASNDYRRALEAYLNFIELKLQIIKSRPGYTTKDYYGLVPYYIKIGDCYKNTRHFKKEDRVRDFEKAAEYYRKAASMYLELEEYPSANVYLEFASKTYEEIELYGKSAECFKDIADIYLTLENNLLASTSYSRVGEFYEKAGDYENAFEAYLRSAELSSGMGDINAASVGYRKVGDVLRKQGRNEEAIKYYVDAAELGKELEHYADVARSYVGIAQNYVETNDLENAAYYYLKAAESSVDNDDVFASKAFRDVGRCYQGLKRYVEAIRYYDRSANISARLKNNKEAACSFLAMAECYKILGDSEKAADFYLKYAEYGSAVGEGVDYMEGYGRSAEIYSEVGDARIKENKFVEAIEFYKKAAMGYDSMKKYAKAGEFYLKAGLVEKQQDIGNFFRTCTEAADKYQEADELHHAAECYLEINEYLQAARCFTEYADKQLNKENLFYAGEGYKNAGICYAELGQREPMTDRFNKAIQEYLKYVEKLGKLGVTEDGTSNIGEAYKEIAESNRRIGNLTNAEKYFEKALDYFKKNKMEDRIVLNSAFLSKVSAKLAVQHGDYPRASDLLSTAITNFEESIAIGGWSERYLKFLEDNVEESRKILTEIGEKPEITLAMDRYSYAFVGTPIIINMTVSNHGNQPISKVTFLSHLPEELEIIKPPISIEELMAKESRRESIKLTTKKGGQYRIKPLEALYEDKRGNKYVKASNVVSIEIVEKPVIDYRNYMNVIGSYKQYADTQLKNGNYSYAGDGYKSVAECYREFSFKRSGDSAKMGEYYKKAIDSYTLYIGKLGEIENLDSKQLSQIADASFKIGDCHESIGDLPNSERYLNESISRYKMAAEGMPKEEAKLRMGLMMNVASAFLSRVKARTALQNKDLETAKELLVGTVHIFENVLGSEWGREYEDFLKKNKVETQDLLNSIGGVGSA